MFNISHQLRLKILDKARLKCHMTPVEMNHHGVKIKIPGVTFNELLLDLRDSPELFEECEVWKHIRMTKFDSRVDTKVSTGEYDGIWPTVCDRRNMRVKFLVDAYHAGRKNWRDWFIQGEEYAPK
jgi:hypothetical protein